jgi:hypothetical protein
MPYAGQTRDLTKQYLGYARDLDTGRPIGGATYLPGMLVALVPQDSQIYPDECTIQPTPVGAGLGTLIMGVVAEIWPGFNGSIGAASYVAPPSPVTQRGTSGVDFVLRGFHPAVLIDQSGAGAVTLTNGLPIIASRATPGYGQGVALATAVAALSVGAIAMLPAAGIGSSITAAALAQAAQTDTLTGAPSTGDVLSVTIQAPYTTANPGVVQTISWIATPLTAAQATTVTTAAAALVAYLNAQPSFSTYFIATSAAGVVTVAVNALSMPFQVTNGIGGVTAEQFSIGLSGMISNSLSFAAATVSGTTVSTAGGATLAGGTGFKGTIPAYVPPS